MRHGTERFFIQNEGTVSGGLFPRSVLEKRYPQLMAKRAHSAKPPADPVPSQGNQDSSKISTQRLQAESASLKRAQISSSNAGATGNPDSRPAYVDFHGQGIAGNLDDTYIEWTVTVAAAGSYTLGWRYALGQGSRPLALCVNGAVVADALSFPNTPSWQEWGIVHHPVCLESGLNTIRLSAIGSSGGNIDYLEITRGPSANGVFSQRIQAENATLKKAGVATQQAGSTGDGDWNAYVDFTGSGAADDLDHTYVEWTTEIQAAGTYQLSWRYALADTDGQSSDRPLALSINGKTVISSLSFPQTASWSDWDILTQVVPLEAGPTTIRLSALGNSGCNIDYLEIAADTATPIQRTFCRLFPAGEQPNADALIELGMAMETEVTADISAEGDSEIPAGYTYLGQFIDHDITSDPTELMDQGSVDPTRISNGRSPTLDLDSLYGLGPDGSSELFEADGVHLKLGMTTPTPRADEVFPNDLPRTEDQKAIVGDPRNDENLAVAQTHLAFIQFHNAIVDKLQLEQPELSGRALFEAARKRVVLHYQSIVLTDFLPRIAQSDVVDYVLSHDRQFYTEQLKDCMPIEFSVAAYRLGHSMVRPVYEWNRVFRTGGLAEATMELLFEFSDLSGDFFGQPTLPSDWIIDWTRFYDFADVPGVDSHPGLNFAREIDAKLSFALQSLPEFRQQDIPPIFLSLATRNLLRGRLLELPTGQAVAQALKDAGVPFTPITPAEIAAGPHEEIVTKHGFDQQTPLWYYILKEAKVKHDGNRLGPVGSWIVAEVFVGLVDNSQISVRKEQPSLCFSMPQLLQTVGDLNPIGN